MQEVSGTGLRGHKVLWRQRHWPEGQGRGTGHRLRGARGEGAVTGGKNLRKFRPGRGAGRRGAWRPEKAFRPKPVEARGWLSAGK